MNERLALRQPYSLKAREGWTYSMGVDFVVKAGEMRLGGSAAFMEYKTRKGEEPGLHKHISEDEMFYVLAGSLTFECDKQLFDLEKGGFIFLPAGSEHGYTITSSEPVRLIVVTSLVREEVTGGWGGFVADMELGQG
jgi:quercetin dioxygenase-like cupin family protein